MRKLTRREQFLLGLLAVTAILVFGVYFAIIPSMTRNSDLQYQIEDMRAEYAEKVNAVARLPALTDERDELNASVTRRTKVFYSYMAHDEMLGMMTRTFLANNLDPVNVAISSPGAAELSPFGGDDEAGESAGILAYNISASLTGKFDDFVTLIDDCSRNRALEVTSFTITGAYDAEENAFTVSFKAYMAIGG